MPQDIELPEGYASAGEFWQNIDEGYASAGEFWPSRRRSGQRANSKRESNVALLLLMVLGIGLLSTLGIFYVEVVHITGRHGQSQAPLPVAQTPLLPLGAAPGDWLEPGFDAQNTNDNVYEHTLDAQNVTGLSSLWQASLPYGPAIGYNIAFAVAHGIIYFSNGDHLIVMNTQAGQVLRNMPLPHGYVSTPVVVGDQLFLTSWDENDNLLAVNLRTGALVQIGSFRSTVSGLDVPAPVAANGLVYAVAQLQELYAIDAQTDRMLWQKPLADVTTTPAVADGVIYVGGFQHLYALDARTGALLWQSQRQSSGDTQSGAEYISGFYPPVVGPQYVYATEDQQILAYPRHCANPCAPAWSFRAAYVFRSSLALADGLVYAATGDWGTSDTLYALDWLSGRLRWSAATNAAVVTAPIIANGVLYLTDWYADLEAYTASGCGAGACQPIWSSRLLDNGVDERAASRVVGGRCYMLTTSGRVIAFGLQGT